MTWKERLYRSLPFVLVLLSAAGIAITDEVRFAIVALVGMWLLPTPYDAVAGFRKGMNVSRETSPVNVSRETLADDLPEESIPVPCVVMHGTAESHVLGCEGWRSVSV